MSLLCLKTRLVNLLKLEFLKRSFKHSRGSSKFSNQKLRNWVFATNSDFLITISLKPNVVDLRYFKLWILLNQIIRVWNIKGLQQRVLKILGFKYLILLQRLNSFVGIFFLAEFPAECFRGNLFMVHGWKIYLTYILSTIYYFFGY